MAWGLGTEAPTLAEADKSIEQQEDLLRKLGMRVPATAGTQTRLSQRSLHALDAVGASIRMVFDVRSGLRRQRRLTVLAIADEAPAVVFYALRAATMCRASASPSPPSPSASDCPGRSG